jgi:predicted NAD/FAD-binding protein
MSRIAIIGSGISGLGCAWFLHHEHEVTVFEADAHIGGHSNTVTAVEQGMEIPIDTGFMVFNRVTYPNLVRLFGHLGVPVKPTDMSFSVRHGRSGLEYCGSSLNHLFAQRRNLLRPSFYRMLMAIDRFNRKAVAALDDPRVKTLTLEEYVQERGYGNDFLRLYLEPMSSAVWSAPPEKMRRFPAASLLRFFHNHGFLGLHTQHQWWTVEGGARAYVERLTTPFLTRIARRMPVRRVRRVASGVEVVTDVSAERFDRVILACHPPESLALLGAEATGPERRILESFHYQGNRAYLHTDPAVMPRTRLAWSSWNYRLEAPSAGPAAADEAPLSASTHYWMNRLQGISPQTDYFVSINGAELIAPERILRTIEYAHPLFDHAAIEAQAGIPRLNADAAGTTETYFAGAWQRYGFHEDGLLSAVQLARQLLGRDPWPPGA